jgi:hypothetical protein
MLICSQDCEDGGEAQRRKNSPYKYSVFPPTPSELSSLISPSRGGGGGAALSHKENASQDGLKVVCVNYSSGGKVEVPERLFNSILLLT